ncbi:MAG: hypothetical protein R3337_00300 [Gammaproteobacteria bacterium]|nr:hypothetical protein [Gammaproteobacteria bacterium]
MTTVAVYEGSNRRNWELVDVGRSAITLRRGSLVAVFSLNGEAIFGARGHIARQSLSKLRPRAARERTRKATR